MKKIIYILMFTAIYIYGATIGKITALNGEVFIKNSNSTIKATLGYEFDKQDLIFTKEGKTQLTFKDNTVITLGKNSKLSIQEYLYSNKNSKNSKAKFKFVKGIFRTITGAIGKANHKNFKIITKNSTIGIRGTIFLVQVVAPPGLKNVQTLVSVVEGSVLVRSNLGKEMVLNVGDTIKVTVKGNFKKASAISLQQQTQSKSSSNNDKKSTSSSNTNQKNSTTTNIKTQENTTTEEAPASEQTVQTVDESISEVDNESEEGSPQEEDKIQEDQSKNEIPNQTSQTPQAPNATDDYLNGLLNEAPADSSAVKVYEDSYLSFGYWQKDDMTIDSVWIEQNGVTDPDTIIDDYISKGAQASYKGDVLAITNGNIANGKIHLDFDFSKESVKGNLNFQATGDAKWSLDVTGDKQVYANGFTATLKDAEDSQIKNVTGELEGNFLGDKAQEIGGVFKATSDSQEATEGVFQGVKQ